MASSTENVKLGVCSVKFNNVDLGYTKGGVEVDVSTTTKKVTVDQFGESEINEIITGRSIKVKVPLAETTLENLVAIMPGATLVTDSIDPTKKRVDVTNGVGTSLLALAQELRLHPTDLPAGDLSEDLVINKAMTPGAMQFAYKVDDERVFNCEFTGYPDAANGNVLYSVGDTTATA